MATEMPRSKPDAWEGYVFRITLCPNPAHWDSEGWRRSPIGDCEARAAALLRSCEARIDTRRAAAVLVDGVRTKDFYLLVQTRARPSQDGWRGAGADLLDSVGPLDENWIAHLHGATEATADSLGKWGACVVRKTVGVAVTWPPVRLFCAPPGLDLSAFRADAGPVAIRRLREALALAAAREDEAKRPTAPVADPRDLLISKLLARVGELEARVRELETERTRAVATPVDWAALT